LRLGQDVLDGELALRRIEPCYHFEQFALAAGEACPFRRENLMVELADDLIGRKL
jgi:hypothetical protein